MKEQLPAIARAAVDSEKQTGCPAELTAAQCILESGWLQHAPGNNCFGIKQYAGCPDRQLLSTEEWFTDAEVQRFLTAADGRTAEMVQPVQQNQRGAKRYRVQDWFAAFPTLADCFARRGIMFTAGRYAPMLATFRQNGDLEALIRAIAPVYATDPHYADSVLRLIGQQDVRAAIAAARAGTEASTGTTA